MDIVFRYFVVVAALVSAINWLTLERRLRSSSATAPPTQTALARKVARTVYGSMIAFFLILGLLQWGGGYADPLFPFYERTTTVWSSAAWTLIAVLWMIHIIGIWRPGVAEAALQLGLFRGPAVSPQAFRLIVTFGLLVNIVVFATLLTGMWGPIPRPTF